MKISLLRHIDRIAGVWICKGLSLFAAIFPRKERQGAPERILVILLSEMGSLVLAYPMFKRIREKYPNAVLSVLLFDKNREMLEMLGVVRDSDILTIRDESLGSFALDSLKSFWKMRRNAVDCVVDCELFARVSSIFSYLSGASIRCGFTPHTQEGLYRGTFINRPVLYNPYQHISHQFVTLIEALDARGAPRVKRETLSEAFEVPNFDPDRAEIERALQRLINEYPVCRDRKLVLIYPSGGALPIRAWPIEHYCRLATSLLEAGYAVGIIGLPPDRPLADHIIEQCANSAAINLCGYTRSIRELMLLFYHAVLLITNDGGPGQFAAMTPIPTIILFGPETPALYGSHAPKAYFFYKGLSCSPCLSAYNHRNSPCDGDNQCLKRISPEQVLAKAREMIDSATGPERSKIFQNE